LIFSFCVFTVYSYDIDKTDEYRKHKGASNMIDLLAVECDHLWSCIRALLRLNFLYFLDKVSYYGFFLYLMAEKINLK